jgi:hypothetical protein
MLRHVACMAMLGLLAPRVAAARTCSTGSSGNWSSPSIWTYCGGGIPQRMDSVRIESGHTVTYDINTVSGDTVYEVWIIEGATLQFPPGEHRLQVWRPLVSAITLKGKLSVSNGTVIAFRSNSGWIGMDVGNQAEFNSDGVSIGPLRKVQIFNRVFASPACGGGEMWELVTTSDVSALLAGDLVQFANGGAQGRMYEVLSTAPGTIRVCPTLPDAMSLGPRLTPHASTAAVFQPGTFPVQLPAADDEFWAWHPWRT